MKAAVIIILVVVALALVALLGLLPRMRQKAQLRARERALDQRRTTVATAHHSEAEQRGRQAELAEKEAQVAAQEARRQRAEADLHETQAQMHERGLADHDIIDESERDDFRGTSATLEPGSASADPRGTTTRPQDGPPAR